MRWLLMILVYSCLLTATVLPPKPAHGALFKRGARRFWPIAGREPESSQPASTPELARLRARRAVPALFPGESAPLDEGPPRVTYGRLDQAELDAAQIRDRPSRAELAATVGQRCFERLVVATHVVPDRQASAARRLATDPYSADAPRLVLATGLFPVVDDAFFAVADLFLISNHGETVPRLRARELILIGAYENQCLMNTLSQFTNAAVEADDYDFVARVLVDQTTPNHAAPCRLADVLRYYAHDTQRATEAIDSIWTNFSVEPGTLHRTERGLSFDLLRGSMRGHVSKNPTVRTIRVRLEW